VVVASEKSEDTADGKGKSLTVILNSTGIMSSGGNRALNSTKTCEIIAGATVDIKARVVTVKGKRGTLVRDFKHLSVEVYKKKDEKTGKDVVVVSFLEFCFQFNLSL